MSDIDPNILVLNERIEELEAENERLRLEAAHANDTADAAIERAKELEAKLAKAVEALMAWKHYDESDEEDHVSLMLNYGEAIEKSRTTLAELETPHD